METNDQRATISEQKTGGLLDFNGLAKSIRLHFYELSHTSGLFTTDASGLWERFLEFLPMDERQHHNCNACRRFVEQYGGLVFITDDGEQVPAFWEFEGTPAEYRPSIHHIDRAVRSANVTGIFRSAATVWGQPITGDWHHMAVLPEEHLIFRETAIKTASQEAAERTQDALTLERAVVDYPLGFVAEAVRVLESDALYRSDKVIGPAKWLKELQEKRASTGDRRARRRFVFRAAANAPAGFCHVRSGMIGTLLDDIAAGLSFDDVSRRFAAKMNPLQYQRPQAAPSAGNIEAAERLVAQLGIADSLKRRYATLEEVEGIWSPAKPAQPAPGSGGVFSHLKPKGTMPSPTSLALPQTKMTWVKFAATVLPRAAAIELHVPFGADSFCALVTAEVPGAPPILQWDREDKRNPFSWYLYFGGSAADRWGLKAGTRARVTKISAKPTHWYGAEPMRNWSEGALFILEGCRDLGVKTGSSIFPETLRSDLHPIRATIEAYSKAGSLSGEEQSSACGLLITSESSSRLIAIRLTVTDADGKQADFVIDRWD